MNCNACGRVVSQRRSYFVPGVAGVFHDQCRPAKSAAARENGKRGGRPRLCKVPFREDGQRYVCKLEDGHEGDHGIK